MHAHHQKSLKSYDNMGYGSITNIANGVSNGSAEKGQNGVTEKGQNGVTEKGQNGVIQNLKIANGESFIGKSLVCFMVNFQIDNY